MSFVKKFVNRLTGRSSPGAPLSWSDIRPTALDWTTRGQSDVAKVPTIPLVGFSFAWDLYHYCLDEKTEILTRTGWKRIIDLDGTELVLSRLSDGRAEFVKPKVYFKAPYKGKMYVGETTAVSFSVTPNHNMFAATYGCKPKLRPIEDLMKLSPKTGIIFDSKVDWHCSTMTVYELEGKRRGVNKGQERKINIEAWARFLGWFLSEGSIAPDRRTVLISQKKYPNRVREVLQEAGFDYKERVDKRNGAMEFLIHDVALAETLMRDCYDGEPESRTKKVPSYLKDAKPQVIKLFLDEFALGDGSLRNDGKRMLYFTSSKQLADDLQELILKVGKRAVIRRRSNDAYIVAERNITPSIFRGKIKEVDYDGMIGCVEVDSHVIMVRRDGKPMWIGNSDLLKTIIHALVGETFRNGIAISARFVKKCTQCGTEYQTVVTTCDVCRTGAFLRDPILLEKQILERWKKRANLSEDTLLNVLKQIEIDLNLIDNAYLAVLKEYEFDEEGRLIGAKPLEILRAAPERMELIIDRNGRFGRSDDGRNVMFCPVHRDNFVLVSLEETEFAKCPLCGLQMLPAYYRAKKQMFGAQGGSGRFDSVYYAPGEILHIKKWSFNIGYGVPPIWAIWQKLLTLMKQDSFLLYAYDLQRPPKGLLILRGNRDSIDKSWRRLEEEAKANPHMIYPLVIEGGKEIGPSDMAQFLDLSVKPNEVEFVNYREEARRTVGAVYGVMPIFTGETGSAGLANEGLQVVVTNRAVKTEQGIFDDRVFPWLAEQLGVQDWTFKTMTSEGRDLVARIQREQMRMNNAALMSKLGYKVKAFIGDDGIDFEFYEPEGEAVPEKFSEEGRRRLLSSRKQPKFEGESDAGRVNASMPKFEGETEIPRKPKETKTAPAGSSIGVPENLPPVEKKKYWFTVGDDDLIEKILDSKYVNSTYSMAAIEKELEAKKYWPDKDAQLLYRTLLSSIFTANIEKEALVTNLAVVLNISPQEAEEIAQTELNELVNKFKADYIENNGGLIKLRAGDDACEKCKLVAQMTESGVSVGFFKQQLQSVGSEREWLVHKGCKCSIEQVLGKGLNNHQMNLLSGKKD